MSRIAFVNGRYVAHRRAKVHVEDRGYQLADGVYEVIAVEQGCLIDLQDHLERLDRSLAALEISRPIGQAPLRHVCREIVRRNIFSGRGMVYLQITRGVAPRNHAFPEDTPPSIVVTARPLPPFNEAALLGGVEVISLADERWARPDIKSVALLPNVLAKEKAVRAGAFEAWLLDDCGCVTEGSASNAWIVTSDGEIVTRQADQRILGGITRAAVMKLVAGGQWRLRTRAFNLAEAKTAAEAFLTSTTSWVKPVVQIDGSPVADGRAGPVTKQLLALYIDHIRRQVREQEREPNRASAVSGFAESEPVLTRRAAV